MEVHIVDAEMGFPRTTGDHIRVLTVPDPKDSRKIITNVSCRYVVSGVEVSFRKNPNDVERVDTAPPDGGFGDILTTA
jgi:hypothetical protein